MKDTAEKITALADLEIMFKDFLTANILTAEKVAKLAKDKYPGLSKSSLSLLYNFTEHSANEKGKDSHSKLGPKILKNLPEFINQYNQAKTKPKQLLDKKDELDDPKIMTIENGILDIDLIDPLRLKELIGLYYLYRLSGDGKTIRCFPVEILEDNIVISEGINAKKTFVKEYAGAKEKEETIYEGGAYFSIKHCLIIRITRKEKEIKDFYPRMLFHIPNNFPRHEIMFIEGISMRLDRKNRPTASREILVSVNTKKTFKQMHYKDISPGTKGYEKLNKDFPTLVKQLKDINHNELKASSFPNEFYTR